MEFTDVDTSKPLILIADAGSQLTWKQTGNSGYVGISAARFTQVAGATGVVASDVAQSVASNTSTTSMLVGDTGTGSTYNTSTVPASTPIYGIFTASATTVKIPVVLTAGSSNEYVTINIYQ